MWNLQGPMYMCSGGVHKRTWKTLPYSWFDECKWDNSSPFWKALNVEMTFPKYLIVLKVKIYHPKAIFIHSSLVVGLLDPT